MRLIPTVPASLVYKLIDTILASTVVQRSSKAAVELARRNGKIDSTGATSKSLLPRAAGRTRQKAAPRPGCLTNRRRCFSNSAFSNFLRSSDSLACTILHIFNRSTPDNSTESFSVVELERQAGVSAREA